MKKYNNNAIEKQENNRKAKMAMKANS